MHINGPKLRRRTHTPKINGHPLDSTFEAGPKKIAGGPVFSISKKCQHDKSWEPVCLCLCL